MNEFNQPGKQSMEPHRATLVLVLGILGIVFNVCFIPGILAWIFGGADLKKMKAGIMDPSGESQTKIGYICGIVGTVMALLGILVYVIFVFLIFGAAVSAGGGM